VNPRHRTAIVPPGTDSHHRQHGLSADLRAEMENASLAREWGCTLAEAHQRKIRALADVVTICLTKRRLGLTEYRLTGINGGGK
jgi:hypothetical protein